MTSKYLIKPGTETLQLGRTLGARILHADPPGTGVALLEHPIAPRGFASAMHTHVREDEFSYILRGKIGFDIGGDVFEAVPGEFVSKPRNVPHAFWNAGDEEALVFEVISPAGFEQFFVELAGLLPPGKQPGPEEFALLIETSKKYELDNDLASIPALIQKYNLVM